MKDYETAINDHYGPGAALAKILEALERAGKDLANLTVNDLAPVDEFHIGGRQVTLSLARAAGLSETSRVIDVGCGIGGPARTLAHHFGCRVTGIDLTQSYCITGNRLTEMVGLSDRVSLQQGDAVELPFAAGEFDTVWMQHISMNIQDKQRLFSEIRRILKDNGKLVFYEVTAGPEPAMVFPVPWSRSPELSYLLTAGEFTEKLTVCGFVKEWFKDVSSESIHWFHGLQKKVAEDGPPSLSLANLMGPDLPKMSRNLLKNLENEALKVVQGIYTAAPESQR